MGDERIAILGASCRFPAAAGLDAFWRLLEAGGDAVGEVDEARWSTRFFHHPRPSEPGKSYTWAAGLIDDVDLFDPRFFGISPREAAQMDPQQRLLLELVWHALEDAGLPAARLAGGETGVYVGASSTDYSDLRLGDPASGDSYFMTGNTLSILANRISYIFDLRGPSLTIDTACSSSLVALHHACEALRQGRIDSAVVGGVNLLLAPYPYLGFCRASMLSRRGRCFAFDARADGYVRAEGGGAIVLKPLAAARADGDPVRAVILASGVNSDGRTIGLSLPSVEAQAELLRAVHARAGVAAEDLAFFEMHGTGTPAGDPIEATAVGRALGRQRATPLPIGSVKSNIGHLEPASGMAGLLKAALALDRGMLPASLNCETPNPNIPFEQLNLRVVRALEPIAMAPQRFAGVNSFGFGGTNAHVVLAAAPPLALAQGVSEALPPLVISARSEAALRDLAGAWRDRLAAVEAKQAAPLLRAAARRRDLHPHRLVALGADAAETAGLLADHLDGAAPADVVVGSAVREGGVAFAFSGNGAQFAGMARAAWQANAAFRDAVAEADRSLAPALGWSVAEAIEHGAEAERLARTDVAQPLLFAIQVGIVRALRELGIEASAFVGHSVGEIAAAWAAGALSLEDAAQIVLVRSREQQKTQGHGRMAALALGPEPARDFLAEMGSAAEIGAINATHAVTISGPGAEIERLEFEARRRGFTFRPLDLDFAFHSPAMEPIRETLIAELAGIRSREPSGLLVSTVSGERVAAGRLDAVYWWHNIRRPVRFSEAMAQLVGAGHRIFVEIGPSAILQSYLNDALRAAEADGRVLASLSRKARPGDPFPAIAARCHVAGCDLTGSGQFDGPADPRGLPLYPWQRERFWFDRTAEGQDLAAPAFEHPLLGFRQPGPAPFWLNHLDDQVLPWLADHAIEGMAVLPAAAVVEMALAAARWRRPDAPVLEIADLELRRPLPFDRDRMRELHTTLGAEDGEWQMASRPRLSPESPTVHAVARILAAAGGHRLFEGGDGDGEGRTLSAEALYRLAGRMRLDYGARFRTVEAVSLAGRTRAVVALDPAAIEDERTSYLLHPALLDGALQGLLGLLAESGQDVDGVSFLPWRFGRVRVRAPFGRAPRRAELHLTRAGLRSASADIALYDESGGLVAELAGCWFRRVELRRGGLEERVLRIDLLPAPLAEAPPAAPLTEFAAIVERLAGAADEARREQALLLDALIGALALQALRPLVEGDAPFTIDELVQSGRLAAASEGLVECLLRLTERLGAARVEEDGRWRLDPSADLPEAGEIWRALLAEVPDLVGELALIAAAAEDLPGALSGGPRPPEQAAPAMVEHLLQASPPSAAAIGLAAATLGEIAANWPEGRPLRILEIGAGAGTRAFLQRLARCNTPFSYLATSGEPDRAARLAHLADGVAGAAARQWSPLDAADELDGARFDIIVAANTCARLGLDAEALARLRDRLAPGGAFVAVEPEPNALWDVVFGRTTGWWQRAGRLGERSPLRSGDTWRAELAAAGFAACGAIAKAAAPWPWAVFWGHAPNAEAGAPTAAADVRAITLVAEDGTLTAALRARLAGAGHTVRVAESPEDLPAVPAEAPEMVLFLADPAEAEIARLAERIAAFARFAAAAADRRAALWLVTRDAQQASAADPGGAAAGAALWGFARVLANELPRLDLRLVDLAAAAPPEEATRQIVAELAAASPESEILWTRQGRHVLRLRRGLPPRWAASSDVLTLTSSQPGGLEALGWTPRRPSAPGPGEVEVAVDAAGLNFRDMMWAMGLLPEEALIDGFAGPSFGLECAGTVQALGPGVEGIAVGDRVMGFAPAAFASRVVTKAAALTPIPPGIGMAAAATIPVTFVTVAYALGRLGQLTAGEHVLVHAAAGGVGLSAIQYAKHRGAIVIATAGSGIKRAFLRLAGADHVLDSRDLGFADAVRAITGGKGVDVVLNSLSGEAMEESLAVLKPFGRFLELGKRDLYLNRRIHLRPLRQNVSYFAIDVDQLPVHRPELAASLLAEVRSALSEGAIRPLAHRVFSFAELDDAFRLMQGAGHIGKLVLVPADNAGVRLTEPRDFAARADGTYLVTGGLDGFGFAAARWLVACGARAIALVSRRGAATPGAAERIAALTAAGARVRVYEADVADREALAAALGAIRAEGPPLRGVIHAAAVIEDGFAVDLDPQRIAANLEAKLAGALNLDALTGDDPVELFLLFSSATTLLGAPGQGGYVAANLALEAIARQRRAAGRPALAIAWGPIEDAGYLAERPEAREALARRLGAKPIPAAQALEALPALLASGLTAAGFAETRWDRARQFLPILAAPLFSELRALAAASPIDEALADRLAALGPDEALDLLRTVVAEEAATILRLPVGSIEERRPLSEIGMDSLMAVELRLALESRLRIDLPLVSLSEGTSVASIAARLVAAMSAAPKAGELVAMAERYEVEPSLPEEAAPAQAESEAAE